MVLSSMFLFSDSKSCSLGLADISTVSGSYVEGEGRLGLTLQSVYQHLILKVVSEGWRAIGGMIVSKGRWMP
jgi:hypothetical protein